MGTSDLLVSLGLDLYILIKPKTAEKAKAITKNKNIDTQINSLSSN